MAKLGNLKKSIEKRLDISKFCKDFYDDPDINNEDWITIKKLRNVDKERIKILQMGTVQSHKQKKLIQKMVNEGYDQDHINELLEKQKSDKPKIREKANKEILRLFVDLDYDGIDLSKTNEVSTEILKVLVENGIDKEKHSFTGEDGEPSIIDFDFVDIYFSEELISFIKNEIINFSNFSKGYGLGK